MRTLRDIECEMFELEYQRENYPYKEKEISLKLEKLLEEWYCFQDKEYEITFHI